ncbi:MAG TPA: hypothetical protein VNZ45_16695 [Bacteroidia bacterium]|nr:hypothetical protein [Bacteroidia bacterium]
MIKYLVLLFNLIGLFLYQLFFQTNVTATQSVPASADAGSSFVVEVSINKADISGFAKYQEDLPKGFTAVAVDKQGATVLSSDNAIKFIWASLPSDATIKISFRVTVDASVTGSQPLSGKFLYVVNNERQEADVAASNITINGSVPVATNTVTATPAETQPAATTTDNSSQPATTTSTPPVTTTSTPDNSSQPAVTTTTTTTTTAPDNTTQPATTTTTTTTTSNTSTPVTAPAPSITVSASRSLSATFVEAASDITISVTIHKSTLSGFAKLEETLPNGVIAAEGDKQGASFTFVDNKVKFVWLSLPTDSVFTVSYKLTPGSTVSGDQSVSGEFSYLLDNNAAKYIIPATNFTVKNAALTTTNTTQPSTSNPPVTTTTTPDNTQPATTTPVTTTTTPDNTQPATTTTPVTTTTTPDNIQPATTTPVTTTTTPDNTQPATTTQVTTTTQPTTSNPPAATTTTPVADMTSVVTPHVSGANGGVMYRVQIMALHNAVKPSYLSSRFKISESINEEMVEGFTKYTVGKFDEYKSSRDHREEIKNKGVAGPFVVAYNDGKRITVQEALMITHQQWYK